MCLSLDQLFVFFERETGKLPSTKHRELCEYMQLNNDLIQNFADEYFKSIQMNLDVMKMFTRNEGIHTNELTICLLCQMYKLKFTIIGEEEIWMTSPKQGLFQCDIYLGYISPSTFVKYMKRTTMLPPVWKYQIYVLPLIKVC